MVLRGLELDLIVILRNSRSIVAQGRGPEARGFINYQAFHCPYFGKGKSLERSPGGQMGPKKVSERLGAFYFPCHETLIPEIPMPKNLHFDRQISDSTCTSVKI